MAKDKEASAANSTSEEKEAVAAKEEQSGFAIEKLYIKDASIEVPNAPKIFTERKAPQVNVELGNNAQKLDEGVYEVAIKITVTAKIEEDTAFLVEVIQAGIFAIHNVPEENVGIIASVTCPNILFPYAREAISDMVVRAGFMPVLLNPINFEALYQQQQAEKAETIN